MLKAYLGEQLHATRDRKQALAAGGGTLLATDKLSAGYGGLDVIHDIDIAVEKGEMVAVLGANGAGKSTLMAALSGLNRPVGGAVLLLGHRIESFATNRIVKEGLVLVPEGRQVFPELSVFDNICLGRLRPRRRRHAGQSRAAARPVPAVEAAPTISARACSPAASNRCWRSRAG